MTLTPGRALLLVKAAAVTMYFAAGLAFALVTWFGLILWWSSWMDR